MSGCNFHWKQTIKDHLKKQGLVPFENDNKEIADLMQCLLSIVYVRPAKVTDYLRVIAEKISKKIDEEKDAGLNDDEDKMFVMHVLQSLVSVLKGGESS